MSGPPLIDRAVFDDLVEHIGSAAARSVLELFADESRGYVAAIGEAAAHPADPARRDRARRAAHSLKSSAGQIGAAALATLAAAIEDAAEEGGKPGPLAAALDQCREESAAALMRLLRR